MNVEGKLQQAISLYQAGQLQQVEQICQQILRDFPQYAKALHLLGVIACQVEEYKIATDLISQAVEIDSNQSQPKFAEMYNNLGNALLGQGRLEESIQAYQQAIHIHPQFAEVHNSQAMH
ncbi:TPA: tetratricopeptide repeat protein [Candidatus Poribacteria bacterium]|nr:tetratricopeptide repeat protein [Candidatus Poribacteria bacterium]HIC01998.1 tetratricopeptide repeat protein [Candidatus Poribacteria bacterium]